MMVTIHLIVMLLIRLSITPFEFLLVPLPVSSSNNVVLFEAIGIGSPLARRHIIYAISSRVTFIGYSNKNLPLSYQLTMNLVASYFRIPKGAIKGELRQILILPLVRQKYFPLQFPSRKSHCLKLFQYLPHGYSSKFSFLMLFRWSSRLHIEFSFCFFCKKV